MATARQLENPKAGLYEKDFLAWVEDQAEALRTRQIGALDWDNLVEEIGSMGRSQRNELKNRLRVLLMHLMKWHWQPEKRTPSWSGTIVEQRSAIEDLLETSPSLRTTVLLPSFLGAWGQARKQASVETGLPVTNIPELCPWSLEDVLADWWPE